MKFSFVTSWRGNKGEHSLPGEGERGEELGLRELPSSGVAGGQAGISAPEETVHTQDQPLALTAWPMGLAIAGSLLLHGSETEK